MLCQQCLREIPNESPVCPHCGAIEPAAYRQPAGGYAQQPAAGQYGYDPQTGQPIVQPPAQPYVQQNAGQPYAGQAYPYPQQYTAAPGWGQPGPMPYPTAPVPGAPMGPPWGYGAPQAPPPVAPAHQPPFAPPPGPAPWPPQNGRPYPGPRPLPHGLPGVPRCAPPSGPDEVEFLRGLAEYRRGPNDHVTGIVILTNYRLVFMALSRVEQVMHGLMSEFAEGSFLFDISLEEIDRVEEAVSGWTYLVLVNREDLGTMLYMTQHVEWMDAVRCVLQPYTARGAAPEAPGQAEPPVAPLWEPGVPVPGPFAPPEGPPVADGMAQPDTGGPGTEEKPAENTGEQGTLI